VGFLQASIGHLNRMFGDPDFLRDNRDQLLDLYRPVDGLEDASATLARNTQQMLGKDSPLGEALRRIEPEQIARILEQQPSTIMEAQRAVVHANLQRPEPYGMTFAWAPSYDYEVNVWESPPSDGGPGWITVLIKSRYPRDEHPVRGGG
jgi:hypothetical protein